MARKISIIQYKRYEAKYNKILEEIPKLEDEVKAAREHGDLSENAEHDAAKAKLAMAKAERADLEELLKCEIVEYDKSPMLVIGSIIRISSPSITEGPLTVQMSDVGDLITEGCLNTNTPLGKIIQGKLPGQFTVGKDIFTVEKVMNPNIEEFIEMYPEEEVLIKSLFDKAERE